MAYHTSYSKWTHFWLTDKSDDPPTTPAGGGQARVAEPDASDSAIGRANGNSTGEPQPAMSTIDLDLFVLILRVARESRRRQRWLIERLGETGLPATERTLMSRMLRRLAVRAEVPVLVTELRVRRPRAVVVYAVRLVLPLLFVRLTAGRPAGWDWLWLYLYLIYLVPVLVASFALIGLVSWLYRSLEDRKIPPDALPSSALRSLGAAPRRLRTVMLSCILFTMLAVAIAIEVDLSARSSLWTVPIIAVLAVIATPGVEMLIGFLTSFVARPLITRPVARRIGSLQPSRLAAIALVPTLIDLIGTRRTWSRPTVRRALVRQLERDAEQMERIFVGGGASGAGEGPGVRRSLVGSGFAIAATLRDHERALLDASTQADFEELLATHIRQIVALLHGDWSPFGSPEQPPVTSRIVAVARRMLPAIVLVAAAIGLLFVPDSVIASTDVVEAQVGLLVAALLSLVATSPAAERSLREQRGVRH
jgi:hypothetical protein